MNSGGWRVLLMDSVVSPRLPLANTSTSLNLHLFRMLNKNPAWGQIHMCTEYSLYSSCMRMNYKHTTDRKDFSVFWKGYEDWRVF